MSFELIPTPHFEKEVKDLLRNTRLLNPTSQLWPRIFWPIPSKEMKSSRTATKFALRLRAKEEEKEEEVV